MTGRRSFRKFLAEQLPGVDASLLPGRAKMIGDVALVRIPERLADRGGEIGKAVLEFYGQARTVLRINEIVGEFRQPRVEYLAGERKTETVHKEYGCLYSLDAAKLMFCLGNSLERMRTALRVRRWETVVDMFAGIGQFSIPAAVISRPRAVHAVELNPEAYGYLVRNIQLNRIDGVVHPHLGDCREIVPQSLSGVADRVIMGFLKGTEKALPAALSALREVGGIIHFHELAERNHWFEQLFSIIKRQAESLGYSVEVISSREVKSYSGRLIHGSIEVFAKRLETKAPSTARLLMNRMQIAIRYVNKWNAKFGLTGQGLD